MIHRYWAAALAALMLSVPGAALSAAAAPPIPPLTAFGQLPNISNIAISPDGKRMALIVRGPNGARIQVHDVATFAAQTQADIGDIKLRQLKWAGPENLVVVYSSTTIADGIMGGEQEWYQAIVLNVKTAKITRVLNGMDNAMNVLADMPLALMLDGKPTLIVQGFYFASSHGTLSLFRIDLTNGYTRLMQAGEEHTVDWVVGPDGQMIGRADYDQKTGVWNLYLKRGGKLQKAYSETAPIDRPSLIGLGRDGASVMIRTHTDGESEVREVSLTADTVSPPIDGLWGSLLTDTRTLRPIGRYEEGELTSGYQFFDAQEQRFWNGLTKLFADENLELLSASDDRSKLVVRVTGQKNGYSYHLIDVTNRKADWLADVYEAIPPGSTGEVKMITYTAGDGMEIPAYLTLPRGAKVEKLPLVVLVHGGPASRDGPGFDWWAQALASRGYAVLQPQFRGSEGFTTDFMTAGYGQWGRKMQTDVSDGVAYLAKQGMIDPSRVCIVGGSYGGYAALAGVTLQKGIYRCAVSIAGPSDLQKMLRDIKADLGRHDAALRYWDRFMGSSDEKLDAISPALHVDGVTSPVLIIHGNDDTVVPIVQSRRMTDALKRVGAKVEMITLKGEDHWLSSSDTRLQTLEATTAFLAANNPVDPAPAAVAAK